MEQWQIFTRLVERLMPHLGLDFTAPNMACETAIYGTLEGIPFAAAISGWKLDEVCLEASLFDGERTPVRIRTRIDRRGRFDCVEGSFFKLPHRLRARLEQALMD